MQQYIHQTQKINCFGAHALNSFSHAGGISTYLELLHLFTLANLCGVVLASENDTVNTLSTRQSDFSACGRGSETKRCTSDIKEGAGLNMTARYWCTEQ